MEKSLVKKNRSLLRSPWINPFDRLNRNNFFDFWNDETPQTVPALNFTEEKDRYKIDLAAPGLKKEDFKIDIDGEVLTISCDNESETKSDGENNRYNRMEYSYSYFSRSLSLPENADIEKVNAKYNDGVLNISIPKKPGKEKTMGKKIEIQ